MVSLRLAVRDSGATHPAMIGAECSERVKSYGGLEERSIHNNTANYPLYPSTTAAFVDQLMVMYVSQMAVESEVPRVELFNSFRRLRNITAHPGVCPFLSRSISSTRRAVYPPEESPHHNSPWQEPHYFAPSSQGYSGKQEFAVKTPMFPKSAVNVNRLKLYDVESPPIAFS
jgi:hypothetical protein